MVATDFGCMYIALRIRTQITAGCWVAIAIATNLQSAYSFT